MTLIHGFVQANKFYDDVHFPHGFSRSGKFNIQESDLLTALGRRLWDLETGVVKPDNQVEESFVEMCKQNGEPETKIERLWVKYKGAIKTTSFHSLQGSSKAAKNDNFESIEEDY